MLAVDLFFGIITLFSIVGGIQRGLVQSVMSCVSWVFALQISYLTYPYTEKLFFSSASSPIYATLLAQAATFILVLCGFSLLNRAILYVTGPLRMGFIDRTLGGMLGICKSLVICGAIYIILVTSMNLKTGHATLLDNKNPNLPDWLIDSYSHQIVLYGQNKMHFLATDKMQVSFQNIYDSVSIGGAEDRFIETMIQEMSASLSESDLLSVEHFKKEYGNQMSSSEMRNIIAETMMEQYHNSHDIQHPISQQKLDKLTKILKDQNF